MVILLKIRKRVELGVPTYAERKKTRDLRLLMPLATFTRGLFDIFQPKSTPYCLAISISDFPQETYMGFPELTPIGNLWPRPCPDHHAGVRLTFSNNNKNSLSPRLGPSQIFPRKHPCTDLSTHPVTAQAKIQQVTPLPSRFKTRSKWTPFHTPNLTPIPISHHHSLQYPRP